MKRRTKILFASILLLGLIIVAEFYARLVLGLGDPPLSVADEEIDYYFAPNQRCNRFGNKIIYNNASMRCDFDVMAEGHKIFVVGDSVINGGVLTDHKKLATTLLQEKLDPCRKDVLVCNVSAGSWGPGNYAAYFRRFGSLVSSGDILIIEVNSHDMWEDDPSETGGKNVGVDIAFPNKKPFCALWDGFHRYAMPRLRSMLGLAEVNTKVDVPKWGKEADSDIAKYNLAMLDKIYSMNVRSRYMLVYRSRKEAMGGHISVGEAEFRKYAAERNIGIIEVMLNPDSDYRDLIHPNEFGQRKVAEAIYTALKSQAN